MDIGVITNINRDTTLVTTRKVIEALERNGANITVDQQISTAFPMYRHNMIEALYEGLDMVLVVGGDGAVLKASRMAAAYGIPVLGINRGHLGFLTEVESGEVESAIRQVMNQEYFIEERVMLQAVTQHDQSTYLGINDIGILRKSFTRVLRVEILVNSHLADCFACDGVVIASPTGSTGYSLSAGGPVVSPDIDCLLITPICPHTLSARPIVVGPNDVVRLRNVDDIACATLSVDGKFCHDMELGEWITVKTAQEKAKFVRFNQTNFFDLLRRKLKEGDSMTGQEGEENA